MKRQMSISIFLAFLVILMTLFYIKISNDTKQKNTDLQNQTEEEETNSITISQEYTTYKFYIKDENGRLVVYDIQTQDVYAQTGIETYTLPIEIQNELETGIFFQTEAELYDFLESYSS